MQEEERARQVFPRVLARFEAALQALPAEQAGHPVTLALAELVAIRAERLRRGGGFVTLPELADILDRHFPATSA
ncbi:hypothetical protein ACIBI9_63365 [Nonomuraea sp. NPDC050451]|uniref:hypothetical protein n=1 Tax=Nonomuraea sp. NPDC050451 TaxID=3364364 RepID=UPI0037BB343B